MSTHEIVIDAKLVFEITEAHEVIALTEVITWLGDRLTKGDSSILKQVGLNIGEKQEEV